MGTNSKVLNGEEYEKVSSASACRVQTGDKRQFGRKIPFYDKMTRLSLFRFFSSSALDTSTEIEIETRADRKLFCVVTLWFPTLRRCLSSALRFLYLFHEHIFRPFFKYKIKKATVGSGRMV